VRILIAEDFPDFRRFICTALTKRLDWRVVAEVADGLEAVQRAAELKPDLIVLDIGLPRLNGIEASRQIRQLSPETKIVFLSQNSDPDVVQAALSTGAEGYIHKAYAQSDLLPGIETVLRGERFVRKA
jgi:DNA-binding NarL/FixJ family response regulator